MSRSPLLTRRTGAIIYYSINAPGSWHDSHVAQSLYTILRDPERTPARYFLVADSAFPHSGDMHNRIRTPPKANEGPPANASREQRLAYAAHNRQLISCRQAAEWGMREIRASFGRLRIPLPIGDPLRRWRLLKLVGRLIQLRARRVGISHIRNTYAPIWREAAEDMEIWETWERMLYSEQRKKDRVTRFYHLHDVED